MQGKELTWSDRGYLWLRLLIRAILFTGFILLFTLIGMPILSFCSPFVFGFLFAWMLEPLVRFFINKTPISRPLVSILLILLICGLLGSGVAYLIYELVQQFSNLSSNWSDVWQDITIGISQAFAAIEQFTSYLPKELTEVAHSISEDFLSWLQSFGTESIIPKTTSFAIKLPSLLLSLLFFLMSLYFILADYQTVGNTLTKWMPYNLKAFIKFVKHDFHSALFGYLRVQLLLSSVVFFILLLGFSLLRIQYALLLAFGLAILDFIPIVGAGTLVVPWAIISLFSGDFKRAFALILIFIVIALFRRIAEPRFLGAQIGLHPLLSLFSIYVGMKTFGVLGMVLAPTLFFVCLRILASGIFDPLQRDLNMAAHDIQSLLSSSNKD